MMDIGLAIRHRRNSLGWNQTTLAEKLKTTATTIARWENSKRGIRTAQLHRIAAALDTTVVELLNGTPATAGSGVLQVPLDIDPDLLVTWKNLTPEDRNRLVQIARILIKH